MPKRKWVAAISVWDPRGEALARAIDLPGGEIKYVTFSLGFFFYWTTAGAWRGEDEPHEYVGCVDGGRIYLAE